jgi:hypothetical protein
METDKDDDLVTKITKKVLKGKNKNAKVTKTEKRNMDAGNGCYNEAGSCGYPPQLSSCHRGCH